MNYTLQLHGERIVYQVPPGLYELMSDISREVLRDQPSQLYKYIANYLDTLLKLRGYSRQAMELVEDVLAENQELFAYVDSLGMSWHQASDAARKIQRAYRTYRAKIVLKEMVKRDQESKIKQLIGDYSKSFIDFFKTLEIDYETATRASIVIQSAFRAYMVRKESKKMSRASTHTIDVMIPSDFPRYPLVLDKPSSTRNKDLLVYEQSPLPSIHSGWYKSIGESREDTRMSSTTSIRTPSVVLDKPKGDRDSRLFVYQQSPKTSIDSALYKPRSRKADIALQGRRKSSDTSRSRTERPSVAIGHEGVMPSYYDREQSKIPMISETGELALEEEIVTLYSGDSDIISTGVPDGPFLAERSAGVDSEQRVPSRTSRTSGTRSRPGKAQEGVLGLIEENTDSKSGKLSVLSNKVAQEGSKGTLRIPSKSLSHKSQDLNEKSATTLTQEPIERPATTLMQEPTESPATTLMQEPSEVPATTLMQEPSEVPATTLIQEPTERPTTTLTQEPTERPSTTLTQDPTEIPATTLTQEPTERPATKLSHHSIGSKKPSKTNSRSLKSQVKVKEEEYEITEE